MIYRDIPGFHSPLPVVTFGGASVSGEGGGYGFGVMPETDAEKLIKGAWEHGITLFDTAPIYGFGLSEERLGRHLPKEAMIVSKCGVDWHPSKRVNMTNDPKIAERMLHESLKRLNRDVIDIYMVHWPDLKVDIRHTLEVLKRAQDQGKIKKIGLCNTTSDEINKAKEICKVEVIQSELNLFNQDAFMRLGDDRKKYFTMGWGTFDKGILSGRVTKERQYDKSDARSWAPWWNKKEVQKKVERTDLLRKILQDYQISLPEFCLQYNLHFFNISTCLIGLKSVSDIVHITSNLQQKLMRERIEEVVELWNNRSNV